LIKENLTGFSKLFSLSLSLSLSTDQSSTKHKMHRTVSMDRKREGNKNKLRYEVFAIYRNKTKMTIQRTKKSQK
jgi:hypothetical protein